MITLKNVWKRYRSDTHEQEWVLRDVSLTIPTLARVGLIGRNGAGKSTLLRIIGGVDQPTLGQVSHDCKMSWPMGFGQGLQGSLTGRQNTKFVARINGKADDTEDIIDFVRDFAEIGDYYDRPVKSYSSGMKARLQFGLSLAFRFDVYISDEVTAVGDRAFRKKARNAFRGLVGQAGLIMVSHDEKSLKEFCETGILLVDGQPYIFDNIDKALKAYHENEAKRAAGNAKVA